ncbi:hypothetical protein AVEN_167324-1 [Araneus ventricosus]|uniref:Uncharacterized protein n=1 Tax=Araneus ventricosus TaxID=182803 RepID=A0A4Y2DBR0_ARAVE|nr:hypothetical protein AVEN_167324-1 [Araneus ventricosus]
MIWAGILGDHLLGPYLLPDRLPNGSKYLDFLQHVLPDLLQRIETTVRQNMWFMYNGAPADFSIVVRNHLDATYPSKLTFRRLILILIYSLNRNVLFCIKN